MTKRFRYHGLLTLLVTSAFFLSGHLVYLFLNDPLRFPINTIKISAAYQHISRKQLESVLTAYLNNSFFALPIHQLHKDLMDLAWTDHVLITRSWPDTITIVLVEKKPVARWGDALMTASGALFTTDPTHPFSAFDTTNLPQLQGPNNHQVEVLQVYKKLSKLLSVYGLHARSLQLENDEGWVLSLTNGIEVHLGKQGIEKRLQQFCKAYPAVFADKPEQVESVDLRYVRGMAVQWKKPITQKSNREYNG